jgi:3-dehydroquinate synthase II
MIARYRGSGTEIYAVAHNPKDAETYLKTMENGTDGIVIDVDDPSELSSFRSIVTSCGTEELTPLKVTSIRSIDVGDRVCIDTCSMMEPGEGMLIGSSSNCLFLIQSESEDNGYVAARPFRVNAGAVHSYILVPGGGTRYLSELAGGDPVLICNKNGVGRSASIGRCKVEVRPLLMVEATDGKSTYNVILQNAETIKMVTPDGSKSVTVLKESDEVLAKVSSGGRHFGMAVEETITEK